MSQTPSKVVVDCSTNETHIVPLTPDEIAEMEMLSAQAIERDAAMRAEAEAKERAKASAISKLAALGLTAEEIAAL